MQLVATEQLRDDFFIKISRVLAALGVLTVHMVQIFGVSGIVYSIGNLGQYGLYVFFILSGYLACNWNGENTSKWIIKKIIRLAPLYFAMMILYVILHTFILNNVPKDSMYFGWFRYFLGANAVLPAEVVFWKGIHAVWYVSVVWVFYSMFSVFWKYLKNASIAVWYIVFCFTTIVAVYFNYTDPLAKVNFFCFVQYFVIGIIAHQYKGGWHIVFVPLMTLFGCYILQDTWFFVNMCFALVYGGCLIMFKNRWCSPQKGVFIWIVNLLDECSYAIYLVHPFFIDFVIPFCRRLSINIIFIGVLSIVGLTIAVLLAHYAYEKPIQKILTRWWIKK